MKIVNKDINVLIPYINNQKIHPQDQINKIASSIKQFGFKQPIVIDNKNEIIVGHGRYEGAKKLGIKEIPCLIADDLTESQIKAYRIADNKLNESEWDEDILQLSLKELDELEFNYDEIMDFDVEMEEIEEDLFDDKVNVDKDEEFKLVVKCENETNKQQLKEELLLKGYEC